MSLIDVYNNGWLFEWERSDRHEPSYFGGPPEVLVSDLPWRSQPLHHIATLRNSDVEIPGFRFGFKTPFLYGIKNEGCNLSYQQTASAAISVKSLEPRKSEESYPYPGYPTLLPYIPLKLVRKKQCDPQKFKERIYNTGWELKPNVAYAIVPDPPDIGFTIWGPSGNDTKIVFEYDFVNGTMRACNQCT